MKKWKTLSVIGLSGLVLAACGDNTETTNTTPTTDDTGVVDETNTNAETEGTLSLQDAVAVYMEEYPNAQIQTVDFDEDSGKWTYEITGVSEEREYDVEIDAISGEILKVDEDNVDEDGYIAFDAIITPEEAIEIATTALAEERVMESWELDVDDNRTKYAVEFQGDDRDVTVDAETGEVLEID